MESLHGDFSGTLSYSGDDGEPRRYEVAGWHDGDRIIQRHTDGLRLCMRVHGEVVMADNGVEVRAAGRDSWVVLESEGDALQRLEITESSSGIGHAWSVDGTQKPFDADARAWRDGMFTVLNGMLQISDLHGQVSTLRGKISSYRGKISSLTSALGAAEDADTRAGLQREIDALQERIRVVEAEIDAYALEARVAAVQDKIDAFDLEGKLAAVEAKIDAFDLDDKVRQVQEQIEALHVDERVRQVETRIEPQLQRLLELIGRL